MSRVIKSEMVKDVLHPPFDQCQQYKVVREIVRLIKGQQQKQALKVLGMGGLSHTYEGQPLFPITRFLPEDEIMVLDVQDYGAPNYLWVDKDGLFPLSDASFDVVVSCDSLEHISSERRPAFLDELLRVARQYVVLAAPFDRRPNCATIAVVDRAPRPALAVVEQHPRRYPRTQRQPRPCSCAP